MAPRKATKETIEITLAAKLYKDLQAQFAERGTTIETFIKLQLRAASRTKVVLRLNDTLNFGKYAGEKIEDILRADTSYMNWVVTTSKNPAQFHEEILTLLEELQ